MLQGQVPRGLTPKQVQQISTWDKILSTGRVLVVWSPKDLQVMREFLARQEGVQGFIDKDS